MRDVAFCDITWEVFEPLESPEVDSFLCNVRSAACVLAPYTSWLIKIASRETGRLVGKQGILAIFERCVGFSPLFILKVVFYSSRGL